MMTRDRVAFGLTDPDGRLGRPADSSKWIVPSRIDLQGDQIAWRRPVDDWADPARVRRGSPELLTDFVAIATAKDVGRTVRAFVNKWGVFELCSAHSLPPAHPARRGEPRDTRRCGSSGEEGIEPVAVYARYAREASAVLGIATDIAAGRETTGTAADWKALGIADPGRATASSLRDTNDAIPLLDDRTPVFTQRGLAEFWLRLVLKDWIEAGDVRPEIDFGTGVPIVFGGEGLFAALAAQLLLAATKNDGVVSCSYCGATFAPKRRPRAGARYCEACRTSGDAANDAARQSRARKRRRDRPVV